MKRKYSISIRHVIAVTAGIFISIHVHSQIEPRVFQDYELCLEGVINEYNDTIIPAKFESIIPYRFNSNDNTSPLYWSVQNKPYVGLYSNSGEELVPVEYEGLKLLEDSLLRVQTSKYSPFNFALINLNSGQKTSNNYRMIFEVKNELGKYLVADKDYSGMLNSDGTSFLNCVYDRLQIITDKTDSLRTPLLILRRDGKYGVLNSELDTIIPFRYKYIGIQYAPGTCKDFDHLYFHCNDSVNHASVIDAMGKILATSELSSVTINHPQEMALDCSTDSTSYAYFYNYKKDQSCATNIDSGKKSKTYKYMQYFDNYHIVESDSFVAILDENFHELHRIVSGFLFAATVRPQLSNNSFDPDYRLRYTLKHSDSILWYGNSGVYKKGSRKRKLKSPAQYGIVNYHTGEKIPAKYNRVTMIKTDSTDFYWAWDVGNMFKKKGKRWANGRKILVIYNADFKEINRYEFSAPIGFRDIDNYVVYQPEESTYLLANEDGKFGGITPSGELVMPFKYDAAQFLGTLYDSRDSIRKPVYKVQIDDKVGSVSTTGQLKDSVAFDNITISNDQKYLYKGDSMYHYSCQDSLINVRKLHTYNSKKSHTQYKRTPLKNWIRRVKFKTGLKWKKFKRKFSGLRKARPKVIDDTLFIRWKQNYTKQDSSNTYFGGYLYAVIRGYVINSEGKVISKKGNEIVKNPNTNVHFILDKKKLGRINPDESVSWIKTTDKNIHIEFFQDNWLVLTTHNNRKSQEGLLNIKTLEYGIPLSENINIRPYEKLSCIAIDEYHSNSIKLLDSTLSPIFPFEVYDANLYPDQFGWVSIVRENGYQLYDTSFNAVSEIYDNIDQYGTFWDLRDSLDNATLLKPGKKLELDQVKLSLISPQHYILHNYDANQYALMDTNLNILLDFKDRSAFNETYRLTGAVNVSELLFGQNQFSFVDSKDSSKQTRFENALFWYLYDGQHPYYQRYPEYAETLKMYPNNYPKYYSNVSYTVNIASRISNITGDFMTSDLVIDTTIQNYYKDQYLSNHFENYTLENGKLKRIEYTDLLNDGKAEAMDALFLKKLNEAQSFGLVCVNINSEIEQLKTEFTFETFGMRFYGAKRRYNIFITYAELEGLMKSPYD